MSALNDFFNRLLVRKVGKRDSISKDYREHLLTHSVMDLFSSFYNGLLPDPDEVLKKAGLTSSVYYELMTDAHVGGSVMQRKSRVKRMELIFVAGKDSKMKKPTPESEKALDFFQDVISGIERIPEVINEILDAPLYGATYLEMFWNQTPMSTEKPNGEIRLTDIIAKPFEWFIYDVDNQLKIKNTDTAYSFAALDIPPNKILPVVIDGTYRNPYGERAFKRAFWPYQFKKGGLRFWTEFLEKYGMPFLFGKLDSKKSQTDLDSFHDDLVDMVRNGVAVSTSDGGGEEIDVVESNSRGGSNDAYKTYKNAMNIEISKAILGETLTIENSESGSQNATETHLEVLESIQDEDKGTVERTFNRLARLITDLNFGKDVPSPVAVMDDQKELSLKLAERDATLTDKLNVKFTKEYISKRYKIDEDHFEIATPSTASPTNSPNAEPTKTTNGIDGGTEKDAPTTEKEPNLSEREFAEGFPLQNGVDRFVEASIERMEYLTDDLKNRLSFIIKSSSDYGELVSRLATMKDAVDNSTYAKMFGQSLDIAYVVGEYGVVEDKI